jgi:aryl-alcohol dehydrogenase-like predicted oxidoreductase
VILLIILGGGPNYTNEELLGKAIAAHGRDKFVIASKFGIAFNADGQRIISSAEDVIRTQLHDSLRRLGTDYIDLYYIHRIDPTIPIEDTIRVLKGYINEGKIRYLGLSECTPSELRRAHAVHPITAVQLEYSLQTRDIEDTILPVARELGVGIVAYSPLGRGLLTGKITSVDQLAKGDNRLNIPRWQGDAFEQNSKLDQFHRRAEEKGCTSAQLALAWVHAQGKCICNEDIV